MMMVIMLISMINIISLAADITPKDITAGENKTDSISMLVKK